MSFNDKLRNFLNFSNNETAKEWRRINGPPSLDSNEDWNPPFVMTKEQRELQNSLTPEQHRQSWILAWGTLILIYSFIPLCVIAYKICLFISSCINDTFWWFIPYY